MTKLLVSVRSTSEAEIALEAGVDILDLKEPARGALGRPTHELLSKVVQLVNNQIPISVALGEWFQMQQVILPPGIMWAKIGLSGLRNEFDHYYAHLRWLHLQKSMSPVRLIGVVYADRLRVSGAGFETVLEWVECTAGMNRHLTGILIDTAVKDRKGLLNWLSLRKLQQYRKQCQRRGFFLALAGSLRVEDVKMLHREVQPDIIALRGAVCAGGVRTSSVQADRVRFLSQFLRAGS